MGEFKAQIPANIAWAFALGTESNAQLAAALARAEVQRMGAFNAHLPAFIPPLAP